MNVEEFTTSHSGIEDVNGNRKKRGMVLPFLPLSLTFGDIKYSVDMPQVDKFLMKND